MNFKLLYRGFQFAFVIIVTESKQLPVALWCGVVGRVRRARVRINEKKKVTMGRIKVKMSLV